MKNTLLTIFIILLAVVLGIVWQLSKNEAPKPIKDTGDKLDKTNLIRLDYPRPNQVITSPLVIKGEARGNWFFEASFPVILTNWDGLIIAQGVATAKGDWMTTEFVPYETTLTFTIDKNAYSNRGSLILKKDNPSGLPENDDALEIPIMFAEAPAGTNGILPYNAGIQGVIMAGPTCPVMKNPPDPNCDDKPVKTNVSVYRASDTSRSIAMLESGADGIFKVSLPPGEYVVMAGSFGVPFPHCSDTTAVVGTNGYTPITITCDTGIR